MVNGPAVMSHSCIDATQVSTNVSLASSARCVDFFPRSGRKRVLAEGERGMDAADADDDGDEEKDEVAADDHDGAGNVIIQVTLCVSYVYLYQCPHRFQNPHPYPWIPIPLSKCVCVFINISVSFHNHLKICMHLHVPVRICTYQREPGGGGAATAGAAPRALVAQAPKTIDFTSRVNPQHAPHLTTPIHHKPSSQHSAFNKRANQRFVIHADHGAAWAAPCPNLSKTNNPCT